MAVDWYPRRIAELAEWHANFSTQATATGVANGLTAGEVTQIAADAAVVELLFNYNETVDAFTQAVTEHRRLIINSSVGTPLPPAPTPPVAISLGIGAATAIEARTRQYANRIKASVAYTPAVGELYGIIAPTEGGPATPSIVKATALIDADVALKIKKSGHNAVAVDMRRHGGAWTQIGVSLGTTFVDTVEPTTPDGCEMREYRVQGLDSNNNRIGDVSPTVSTVTMP